MDEHPVRSGPQGNPSDPVDQVVLLQGEDPYSDPTRDQGSQYAVDRAGLPSGPRHEGRDRQMKRREEVDGRVEEKIQANAPFLEGMVLKQAQIRAESKRSHG